jgi:hypothetical protein
VIVDASPFDAAQCIAQYELLRSHIIAAAGDASHGELRRSPKTTESGVMWRETWVAGIPALEDWV